MARELISTNFIKTFQGIFDVIPKSVVARDLGLNNVRFSKLMQSVDQFILTDLFQIAVLLEVDEMVVLKLAYHQYKENRKNGK